MTLCTLLHHAKHCLKVLGFTALPKGSSSSQMGNYPRRVIKPSVRQTTSQFLTSTAKHLSLTSMGMLRNLNLNRRTFLKRKLKVITQKIVICLLSHFIKCIPLGISDRNSSKTFTQIFLVIMFQQYILGGESSY